MNPPSAELCPPAVLSEALEALSQSSSTGVQRIAGLLSSYGGDARLHFLLGSLLAGERRYGEAREAMATAVELAPGFAVARFQLGLLLLSSGDATAATAMLQPLLGGPGYLSQFAAGLDHLMQDRFAEAAAALQGGIAQNDENAPMNQDMRLLAAEIARAVQGRRPAEGDVSSTQIMLQFHSAKSSLH